MEMTVAIAWVVGATRKGTQMSLIHLLLVAALVLVILWLLGLSALNLGAFAWVFLVVAIIAVVGWALGGGLGGRRTV